MDGKGKYKNKAKEISSLVSQYSNRTTENQSKVIYCFDCDDYDSNQEDKTFLQKAVNYCNEKNYDVIWFCKDIERVYLDKKVDDKKKKSESARFKNKSRINTIDEKKLTQKTYKNNTSNILNILDKYLERK